MKVIIFITLLFAAIYSLVTFDKSLNNSMHKSVERFIIEENERKGKK